MSSVTCQRTLTRDDSPPQQPGSQTEPKPIEQPFFTTCVASRCAPSRCAGVEALTTPTAVVIAARPWAEAKGFSSGLGSEGASSASRWPRWRNGLSMTGAFACPCWRLWWGFECCGSQSSLGAASCWRSQATARGVVCIPSLFTIALAPHWSRDGRRQRQRRGHRVAGRAALILSHDLPQRAASRPRPCRDRAACTACTRKRRQQCVDTFRR